MQKHLLSASEARFICRHFLKQSGLVLTEEQARSLWQRSGFGPVLGEPGEVAAHVCVRLVDFLCEDLTGEPWPLNGDTGVDRAFFHRFSTAAIADGYAVADRPQAAAA